MTMLVDWPLQGGSRAGWGGWVWRKVSSAERNTAQTRSSASQAACLQHCYTQDVGLGRGQSGNKDTHLQTDHQPAHINPYAYAPYCTTQVRRRIGNVFRTR